MFGLLKWILAVVVAMLLIIAIGNLIEGGYFERAADFLVAKFGINGYFWKGH